ncbi:MAG: ATP-binding protein [Minisyncoccia bacterium]
MKSIKGRLLSAFLSVVLILSLASLGIFATNLWVTEQYKSASDAMIAEFRLVDNTKTLIDAFNTRVQSAGTDTTESQERINHAQLEIHGLFVILDSAITDTQSRSDYLGFKASVERLMTQIDDSLRKFEEESIKDYFSDYNEANKLYGFVRENGTALIFSQLQYQSSLQDEINQTYRIAIASGLGILVALIVGSIFFAFRFANRLVRPLVRLTKVSQQLAHGDFSQDITPATKDEIGVLASSFNEMTGKLQDSRSRLEAQIKETESKAVLLEEQVDAVSKSKTAILNLLEDIEEEKKKVEGIVVERTKELSDEKARLLASINSLSFGFVLADSNDTILLKNPTLQTILEYPVEPHTIHDIAQLLKSAGSKIDIDIASSCKRCMELKQPVEFKEVPFGKKFLRIICAPILAATTNIGYVFVVEDITEAKVLERSRDEFFSIASHELRTPLTAIQGNASMLLDMYATKLVDNDMKEMLTDISVAGTRLIKIVNDFLEVSRIEQGRLKIEGKPLQIADVITEVVSEVKGLAEKKKLTLAFSASTLPLPLALADRDKVKEIVMNLMANAINYCKEGGVTINADVVDGAVRVQVTDTGVGISLEHQSLLFHKFQQAGDVLARDITQSTGLGLYIAKLLVEAMGGTVYLERSEPGKGSTFAFTLPIAS